MPDLHEFSLDEIQAIILKPHGRDFVKCLFLVFGDNPVQTKDWISEIAEKRITSAEKQNIQSEDFRHGKNPDEIICCFYLSRYGYKNLNIAMPPDPSFRNGMKPGASNFLEDPRKEFWQKEFQKDLCAMVLLAGNNGDALQQKVIEIKTSFAQTGANTSSFVESGKRLFYRLGNKKITIEPFGFRDGLSQPEFHWERDRSKVLKDRWVTVLDQNFGSYLVFRKLKQDVVKFKQKVLDLSKELNIPSELVEAQIVGRFKDGTPLTLFRSPSDVKSEEDLEKIQAFNEFRITDPETRLMNYSDDPDGKKCPFHAHIRQVNPREDSMLKRIEDYSGDNYIARIVRRGIPYDNPGEGVGMLFMSFQSKVIQFATLQKNWAKNPRFFSRENHRMPVEASGLDPVLGKRDPNAASLQLWNKGWGKGADQKYFDFSDVVQFRGGEFFYAPPIPFLVNLRNT